MIALITWPTYGTWLTGPARGWIERKSGVSSSEIPEPDLSASFERRKTLHWPAIDLDDRQRHRVVDDIDRLATLRAFRPIVVVVARDHVHLLVEIDDDREIPRFVQLVKGSLSRTLSCGEGDPSPGDRPHHKWWAGHYSVRVVDGGTAETMQARLRCHGNAIVRTLA